eukprot:312397-Rhodomonas_salina.1
MANKSSNTQWFELDCGLCRRKTDRTETVMLHMDEIPWEWQTHFQYDKTQWTKEKFVRLPNGQCRIDNVLKSSQNTSVCPDCQQTAMVQHCVAKRDA